jgi:tetratricopeptide (TPR) repeat protein
MAGIAALFTTESFELARQRLRPGGMMVQWLHGYRLFSDDFRMIVNTFRSVFPSVSIWNTTRGDYLLVGVQEPAPVDLVRLKNRYEHNPAVRDELQRRLNHVGWAATLGYFMLNDEDTARLAAGAGLNTDVRLPLEFSAARALYAQSSATNWTLVRSYQTSMVPPVTADSQAELQQAFPWYAMGMTRLAREDYEDAVTAFDAAVQIDPGLIAARIANGWAHLKNGEAGRALAVAQDALARQPQNNDALYLAGMAAEKLGRFPDMAAYLTRVMAVDPEGKHSKHFYSGPVLQYHLGLAYARVNRYPEAETAFRRAIALHPHAAAYNSLSRLLLEVGRAEEALSAADESLRRDPTLVWAHFNRAWALEKLGRFTEAARNYEKALELDPSLEDIKQRLLALKKA